MKEFLLSFKIQKDAQVLLPVAIKLEDWIERRIGAEAPMFQNSGPLFTKCIEMVC